jgi:PPOX class probable F420-dependent enzyme
VLDTTTEAGKRAQRRLHEEEIAWLTTVRADGQPQSVPVWFLYKDGAFLLYSQPRRVPYLPVPSWFEKNSSNLNI